MRLIKGLLASVLLAGAMAANAVPVTWEDVIDFNPDRYIGSGDSYSYTHNIGGPGGYTPFVDLLYGYSLSVNLYDDSSDFWLFPLEIAKIDVPGTAGDVVYFDLSGSELGGWSLVGYLQLALTGFYDVTISSILGDFYLGDSTLTAWGEDLGGGTSVPEPGTLGLMGLALLGAGAAARKKKKA